MRIADKKRLLSKVNPTYRGFLEVHTRMSSTKPVLLVTGSKFEAFLQTLVSDQSLDDQKKLIIGLCLSGGMRITECLGLKRIDIEKDQDKVFITCRVLKRRRFEERQLVCHPILVPILIKYIENKRGLEKLFAGVTQDMALYYIKKTFAANPAEYKEVPMDLHALRHSYISFLAFTKNMSAELISSLQVLEIKTIQRYLHADQKEVLKDVFTDLKKGA